MRPDEESSKANVTQGICASNNDFESFMSAHQLQILRFIHTKEFDWSAADDIWISTFETAFVNFKILKGMAIHQQQAWLLTTARHHLSNHARQQQSRRRILNVFGHKSHSELVNNIDPSTQLVEMENTQETRNLMQLVWPHLNESDQIVLTLAATGCSGREMAAQLQISHGAARKRLALARKKAREAIFIYSDDGEQLRWTDNDE